MAVVEYTQWDVCCGSLVNRRCQPSPCGGTVEVSDWLLPAGSVAGPEYLGNLPTGCCGAGSGSGPGVSSGSGGRLVKFRDVWVPSCLIKPAGVICQTDPTDCCPPPDVSPLCCPHPPNPTYPSILHVMFHNVTRPGGCSNSLGSAGYHFSYPLEGLVLPLTFGTPFPGEWSYQAFYATTLAGPDSFPIPVIKRSDHQITVRLSCCGVGGGLLGIGLSFLQYIRIFDQPIGSGDVCAASTCTRNTVGLPANYTATCCQAFPCPVRPVFISGHLDLFIRNLPSGPCAADSCTDGATWGLDYTIFE